MLVYGAPGINWIIYTIDYLYHRVLLGIVFVIIYHILVTCDQVISLSTIFRVTVYPKKYAHGFCFAVLCCGYTLTDFPISIKLASLALWQSNDCPSASKATLMNMDKYFMWIHYERLHNHNKAKHNKTVCIFLGIYCILVTCDQVISSSTIFRVTSLILAISYDCHGAIEATVKVGTKSLIHWGRDKMAAIFLTTFWNAFSWMKMHEFCLRFHWNVFRRFE